MGSGKRSGENFEVRLNMGNLVVTVSEVYAVEKSVKERSRTEDMVYLEG